MAERRIILEMGSGNDLYGCDYTKAACRAVQDALHHSSIVLFKSLGYDHRNMRVQVTIGVQEPDKVDIARVCEELPRGRADLPVRECDVTWDAIIIIATSSMARSMRCPRPVFSRWNSAADSAKAPIVPVA